MDSAGARSSFRWDWLVLFWLIPWFLIAPKIQAVGSIPAHSDGPRILDILKKREAWGTLLGLSCSNYA
jgi:hypothetical protein